MMSGGVQEANYDSPDCGYGPSRRTAYLPDNDDGRKLLRRLKYAFPNRPTFMVGQFLTRSRQYCNLGIDLPENSRFGGVHGCLDGTYLAKCNQEFDALGGPSAEACHRSLAHRLQEKCTEALHWKRTPVENSNTRF